MRSLTLFLFLFITTIAFASGEVLLIVGTRPEAIKMAPIYQELKKQGIPTLLCSTGQHAELLDGVFSLFEIKPDIDLKIMKPGQDLFYVTQSVLTGIEALIADTHPSLVVVQGDTTSAMVAALATFYHKIPIAHVEAGLRSGNIQAPFPEEMNRKLISMISTYHFAPTKQAALNLLRDGVKPVNIFCTGNTVVDALLQIKDAIHDNRLIPSVFLQEEIKIARKSGRRILLLTAHRRESFGEGLNQIFSSIKHALIAYPNLHVIYIKHPNPSIQRALDYSELEYEQNLSIFSNLTYHDMIYLMSNVDGIATDSGGIQEEGAALGKPVLILRSETDRPEVVDTGGAKLVGTDPEKIAKALEAFMKNTQLTATDQNIYGDGSASVQIVEIIKKALEENRL